MAKFSEAPLHGRRVLINPRTVRGAQRAPLWFFVNNSEVLNILLPFIVFPLMPNYNVLFCFSPCQRLHLICVTFVKLLFSFVFSLVSVLLTILITEEPYLQIYVFLSYLILSLPRRFQYHVMGNEARKCIVMLFCSAARAALPSSVLC